MEIAGKVALISGGASGLGAATARMIVAAGGHAVILDLNEKAGEELAVELGHRSRFVRADASDDQQVQHAVDFATRTFGELHICVNCAGIADAERTITRDAPADLGRFSKVIGVNLIGTFNVARLAAWIMAR